MTKKSYVDAVMAGISDGLSKSAGDIAVRYTTMLLYLMLICTDRLLLSIDRRQPINEAYDTLRLCADYTSYQPCKVVGIDLSGDPKVC